MTIILSQDTNFRGRRQEVESQVAAANLQDIDDLRGTTVRQNPSSLRMEAGDAVLLCSKKDWKGEVLYLRGRRNISDLGDESAGGRRGFRNTIRSVRVRPFLVDLNITVVTGEDGTFPGGWNDRADVEADIATLIGMMNSFFRRESALVRLRMGDLTYEANERYYTVAIHEYRPVPSRWKKRAMVDCILSNRIINATGVGTYPWHGKHVLVSATRANDGPGFSRLDKIARTWAHELGHYWGLEHQQPLTQDAIDALAAINPNLALVLTPTNDNIMIQSGSAGSFDDSTISVSQLNTVHQLLARNLARKADRIETIANNLV